MPRSERRRFRACRCLICTAALAAGLAEVAQAATLYWDADGNAIGNNIATGQNLGGSANWEMPNRWFDPAAGGGAGADVAWSPLSDAVFAGSAPARQHACSFAKASGCTTEEILLALAWEIKCELVKAQQRGEQPKAPSPSPTLIAPDEVELVSTAQQSFR